MLIEKNKAYGNSALDPVRVFSQADPAEQIRVRIDDKLSRLARGSAAGEDALFDLIGYLFLLLVAENGNPKSPLEIQLRGIAESAALTRCLDPGVPWRDLRLPSNLAALEIARNRRTNSLLAISDLVRLWVEIRRSPLR